MIDFVPHFFSRLSTALLCSVALSGGALAQSLPDLDPETIANDVERRTDPRTGEAEYIAASFDPFEGEPALAGSASLRRGAPAVAINGQPVSGGAYLDISFIYTANSADSFDVRGFEAARFHSGQPVSVIRYDRQTLDCSRNTHVVSYDSSYYRGASYGYLGGLYRLYPRYRGHRHFGWNAGIWNRNIFNTSYMDTLRRRNYGRAGLEYYGRTRTGNRESGHTSSQDNRRDRDRNRSRNRHSQNEIDRSESSADQASRRDRRENGEQTRRRNRDQGTDQSTRSRREGRNRDTSRTRTGNRNRGADRRGHPDRVRNSTGENQAAPTTAQTRQRTPRREVSTTTPRTETPRTSTPRASTPRPASSRPARTSRPAVNRSVDRVFRSSSPKSRNRGNRGRNFYPGHYVPQEVSVSYRCVKEETLTVHIPQDRLDAARFDGFAVMVIDNSGKEVPVFVPPNYVEGFRKAAGYARGQNSGYYDQPQSGYLPQPPVPAAPQGSSRAPIVYGNLD